MKKNDFIKELKKSLNQFSEEEIKDIVSYYEKMITERTDEGVSEDEAVKSLGDIKVIAARIKSELIGERLNQPKNIVKTSNNFFILLMLFASPALIPLGIVFFTLFITVFILFASLTVSIAAGAVSMIISLIPVAIMAASYSGAGLALVSGGVLLMLIGVFSLLAILTFNAGMMLMNKVIKFMNKTIKKFNKAGDKKCY